MMIKNSLSKLLVRTSVKFLPRAVSKNSVSPSLIGSRGRLTLWVMKFGKLYSACAAAMTALGLDSSPFSVLTVMRYSYPSP